MQATPDCDGNWLVFTTNPAGAPLVTIGIVTVPGAMFVGCEVAAAAVCMKTLTGKFVPVKLASGNTFHPPATSWPPLIVLARFLSIRNRPSPCVPLFTVAITNSDVDPVVHPLEQVP